MVREHPADSARRAPRPHPPRPMQQTPSTSPERQLEAQYQGLLNETFTQQLLFVDVTRRIGAWYERAPGITPNGLLAESRDVRQRLDNLTRERIAVMRAMEHRPTIEDVYPRIRLADPPGGAAAGASMVAALFDGHAPHSTTSVPGLPATLSTAEARAFSRARLRLCRRLGYEVEQDQEAIVLRRGPTTIRMLHFALPSSVGLGGKSRISHMAVHAREKRKDVLKFNYDRGWDAGACCSDVAVMREIDRVGAAFG